jgi:hypothetical protein
MPLLLIFSILENSIEQDKTARKKTKEHNQ